MVSSENLVKVLCTICRKEKVLILCWEKLPKPQVKPLFAANRYKKANISLTNLQGQALFTLSKELQKGPNEYLLDVTHLPLGVYFVRLQDESGNMQVQRLVVAR